MAGFDDEKFRLLLKEAGITNFNHKELLVGCYKPLNTKPPERLWHNIIPTLVVLDALRDHYQKSIKLISAYRSEDYNDPVKSGVSGRAPGSTHQAFSAIGFKVDGVQPKDVLALLREWECRKVFWSGVTFKRVDEKLSSGKIIKMGPMWSLTPAGAYWGVEFQFRGFVKAYGTSFTHLDTRGLTSSSPGDPHQGEAPYDEGGE